MNIACRHRIYMYIPCYPVIPYICSLTRRNPPKKCWKKIQYTVATLKWNAVLPLSSAWFQVPQRFPARNLTHWKYLLLFSELCLAVTRQCKAELRLLEEHSQEVRNRSWMGDLTSCSPNSKLASFWSSSGTQWLSCQTQQSLRAATLLEQYSSKCWDSIF